MIQIDLKKMKKINLNQKHILFDSCVVGELFKDVYSLKDLLESFEKNGCVLCVNNFVKLEFLRIAKKKNEYKQLEEFLNKHFFLLPTTPDIYENAFQLASIYNLCDVGKKQISITDLFNGTFLHKYSQNLLLLTFDIYDYPLEIFNRVSVGVSDIGKRIITWAIYEFDYTKYKAKFKIFQK